MRFLLLLAAAATASWAGPRSEFSRLDPLANLIRERPGMESSLPEQIRSIVDGSSRDGSELSVDDLLARETANLLLSARERVLADPAAEKVLGAAAVAALAAAPKGIAPEPPSSAVGRIDPRWTAKLAAVELGLHLTDEGLARVFGEEPGPAVAAVAGAAPARETLSRPAADIVPAGASPALREVLGHFLELSKIFRPSKGEQAAREHILKLAKARGLETFVDAAGNLLVRVPGTGRFAGSTAAIALQAHLDMVLDARPELLEGGKKIEDIFRSGIELVAEDGWVHSKGFRTTIGADNGLSVAIMQRYITAEGLEHPPLELVFTVDEEDGMSGAAGLEVPLTAKSILNLDGEDWGIAWIGGMGAKSALVTHAFERAKVPEGFASRKIALSGLLGGHSGIEIHLGRANTVRIFAEILQKIERAIPEALLLRASAGTQGIYNKIPSVLDFDLAVPAGQVERLQELSLEIARELKSRFAAVEKSDDIKMRIRRARRPPLAGLSMADAARWAAVLLGIPDGVTSRNEALPNEVEVSSNIGFLKFSPKGKKAATMRFGIMPRAYADDKLDAFTERALALAHDPALETEVVSKDRSPPWNPDPKSGLLARFLKVAGRYGVFRSEIVPAGLETGYFAIKFPDKEMISVGSTIKDAHSFRERFEIESLDNFLRLLDEFLATREP